MINDILDLSKLEAGRLEAHCEVFDVHASVECVIASMQATAGAKKLSLHFKPFRQINTGQSRHNEGTGLGLVICQRLAALLGGGVTVASRWTEGSAFTLTTPLVKAIEG